MGPPPAPSVRITTLQLATPDARCLIIRGRPLRIQLELQAAHEQELEVVASFSHLRGGEVLRREARLRAPQGSSWHELRLPPDSLPRGRYSLAVELVGHDLHRSRRPVDVLQVPEALPPSLQDEYGVWTRGQGELPRDVELWRVEQVRVQTASGAEPAVLPADQPIAVEMAFRLTGLPPDPMVRLQLFSAGGKLLLGNNTSRWGISLGQGDRRTLRARFERLNLESGHYLVTVGLWSDEWAAVPYQARHGYYELLVDQLPGGTARRLHGELSWLGAAQQGAPPALLVGSDQLARGEQLTLQLTVLPPGGAARAWVQDQHGAVLAEATTPALVSGQPASLQWNLRVHLADGEYTLCYSAWDPRQRSSSRDQHQEAEARFPFRVKGGGNCRSERWEVDDQE